MIKSEYALRHPYEAFISQVAFLLVANRLGLSRLDTHYAAIRRLNY